MKFEKLMKLVPSMGIVALCMSVPCYAAGPDLAKPLVTWVAGQMSWVAIGAGIFMCVRMAMQRSVFGAVGSLLAGGFLAYVFANPEKLKTWGDAIGGLIQ